VKSVIFINAKADTKYTAFIYICYAFNFPLQIFF